ncbi:MAG: ribonuclease H family protein [Lachnospiraceae bacterium]|nr:ribonuclease H family protein [Lachnospiraceae bacterium]
MAAKKFYAVKKGKVTGVFTDWESCKGAVDGYPGADFKGFGTLSQAQEYLGMEPTCVQAEIVGLATDSSQGIGKSRKSTDKNTVSDYPAPGHVLAYVDGSYEDSIKKYAFGCVFILPSGEIYTAYGNGDNEQSLQQRNVTGEMLGAMYAAQCAILNGYQQLELRYDYEGVEKWVTGAWRSKNELTQKYAAYMRECGKRVRLVFTKVAAHTNVRFNEVADGLAKKGLTEGKGVPRPCKFEEMEPLGEEWN